MTTKGTDILHEALTLPDADRAGIAERLLATLAPDGEECSDDELGDELQRRLDEHRLDPTAAVSWADLKNES